MQVIPVAGYDSMLLNLCGAHAPYFTRNLVLLTDNAGNTGIGEVPGGEASSRRWSAAGRWSSASRSAPTTGCSTACARCSPAMAATPATR